MGEPPLPARESFSYLGLSLSFTLLRVPPPSCPQRRRCTSSKETALDTRYERIIEIDRGRSWEKGRSRRNLVSRSTRFIDCSNYARALAGLKKSPISFSFRISSRTVPLRLRKVSSPSRKISLLVLPARSTLADEKKME